MSNINVEGDLEAVIVAGTDGYYTKNLKVEPAPKNHYKISLGDTYILVGRTDFDTLQSLIQKLKRI